jgi:ABC-type uncharacterized transport system involved in gliding motility auxiliary subunit
MNDMAEERTETRELLVQGSTLGAGVVMAVVLFVIFNYLSDRHYLRWDWTSSDLYSLSEKSENVVRGLDRDVDLVIFLSPDSQLYAAADELLSRYAAVNPGKVSKRTVDPAKNLLEARRLVEQYGIERDSVVVVATADDKRVIDEFDLAEYDYSGAQFGQGPTLKEFKGEQLITSALLELVEAEKPRILFTTGHGEGTTPPGERSLSRARDLLGKDNFEIEEWSSLGKPEVPADADLVVVAGPTTNFLPPELEVFTRYLESGGRMLLLLDPVFAPAAAGADVPQLVRLGLEDWLAEHGVEVRDDVVIDPANELPFFGPETLYTDAYGSHPIVDSLEQTRTRILLPLARSVSAASDAPQGYEVTELVRTSDAAWGETDLAHLDELGADDRDTPGPVSLGVAVTFPAAEPKAAAKETGEGTGEPDPGEDDSELDLLGLDDEEPSGEEGGPQARLVVYGDFDFATDSQIANAANSLLLLNTLNWLVQREQLIDIEGRKPEQTSLSLSSSELWNVYILVLLGMPGLAVVLGIWVYRVRRR